MTNTIWRILVLLLASGLVANVQAKGPPYAPYQQTASNVQYNQLFCDHLASYKQEKADVNNQDLRLLFDHSIDTSKLRKLANSTKTNSRLRLLAYQLLAKRQVKVPKKVLLGVIVEVAFDNGLNTLAAYRDLSVEYIHRNGKLLIVKKPKQDVTAVVRKLFQESQLVIEKINPWSEARLPPPAAGTVRMTFLASDGIYFGQGTMSHLARSHLAGPVLTAATELLFKINRH